MNQLKLNCTFLSKDFLTISEDLGNDTKEVWLSAAFTDAKGETRSNDVLVNAAGAAQIVAYLTKVFPELALKDVPTPAPVAKEPERYDDPSLLDPARQQRTDDVARALVGAFPWRLTAEGAGYWGAIYDRLKDIGCGALRLAPEPPTVQEALEGTLKLLRERGLGDTFEAETARQALAAASTPA